MTNELIYTDPEDLKGKQGYIRALLDILDVDIKEP